MSYSGHPSRGLTPLQRCSRCILQPQLIGPILLGVIFRTPVEGSYPSAEMQSVYSTAPVDRAKIVRCHIRTLVEGSYPSAEMQSVYSTAPVDWAKIVRCHIQDTRRGVLPLCRDAVGVFYSPTPADWANNCLNTTVYSLLVSYKNTR